MDFTQSQRLMATYDEHAEILKAILAYRADQACMLLRSHITTSQSEVRKITLHQWYLAKQES
jgi:DNA-binding GntR family transcriptional regulator